MSDSTPDSVLIREALDNVLIGDADPKTARAGLGALANLVEQQETLRQALRETWNDYAIAIDAHASDEVRKEARHAMLHRFSGFQDEGWLASSPASESNE